MMKLYTSYYSNMSKIPENFLRIGISRFIPKDLQTTTINNFLYTPNNILAPSQELLFDHKNGKISNEEYAVRYYKEIQERMIKMGFSNSNEYFARMVSELEKSDSYDGVVFLCYEKPNEFCHRHLLSALMRKNGIDIQEYQSPKKNKSEEEMFSSALF